MNKFFTILKKELRELVSLQLLIPVLLIFVLFYFMGDFFQSLSGDTQIEITVSDTEDGTGEQSNLNITNSDGDDTLSISQSTIFGLIDNDNSELSRYVVDELAKYGMIVVTPLSNDPATACEELLEFEMYDTKVEVKLLAVINQGFEQNLLNGADISTYVDMYSTISSFGMMSSFSGASSSSVIGMINGIVSQKLFDQYIPDVDSNTVYSIQNAVRETPYTYMNGETAQITSGEITAYISLNTMFVPIIVFLIIIYSMQTLATSVVTEKADKTLETLMTAPVSRMSVLFAKILSAAIYAIVFAVIYTFGMQNFMGGLTGGETFSPQTIEVIETFGISFNFFTFAIIGVQLFLSVLCGLGIALIIGIMLDDIKTLQAYIMPIMIIIMIPYFVSIFTDINSLPAIFRVLIYIIPFTHTFAAAINVFSQNYAIIAGGIIYQIIFVIAMLAIAMKIFNSDKLITLSEIIKSNGAKKKSGIFAKK